MGALTHRARATATLAVIMVSTMLVGCGVWGDKSPTQQYEQAVHVYTGAVDTATIAVNNDWVSLAEAEAINQIRLAAYGRLTEMRSALEANPVDPGTGFEILVERYSQVVAALVAMSEEPDSNNNVTPSEPLTPLPPAP